jgi:O-antigen/teichoic acid export membrane protein
VTATAPDGATPARPGDGTWTRARHRQARAPLSRRAGALLMRVRADTLLRNSLFLMAGSLLTSLLGFGFWLAAARLYPTSAVGTATTLVAAATLISQIGLLGTDSALIRFLSSSAHPRATLTGALSLAGGVGAVLGLGYALLITWFSPTLAPVMAHPAAVVAFVVAVTALAAGSLCEAVFVARRRAEGVVAKNAVAGLAKLVLLVVLTALGSAGVFVAFAAATGLATLVALAWIVRAFQLWPRWRGSASQLRSIGGFAVTSYAGSLLGGLPVHLMPLIITERLGPTTSAYFYMAVMIATLLYMIPDAITRSLFAEGASAPEAMRRQVLKALRIITVTMTPLILGIVVLGRYVLAIFGSEYADNALGLLRLLAVAGAFVSVNYVGSVVLHLQLRNWLFVVLNGLNSLLAVAFGYLWIGHGLAGIGWSWIAGETVVTVVYAGLFLPAVLTSWRRPGR